MEQLSREVVLNQDLKDQGNLDQLEAWGRELHRKAQGRKPSGEFKKPKAKGWDEVDKWLVGRDTPKKTGRGRSVKLGAWSYI